MTMQEFVKPLIDSGVAAKIQAKVTFELKGVTFEVRGNDKGRFLYRDNIDRLWTDTESGNHFVAWADKSVRKEFCKMLREAMVEVRRLIEEARNW